MRRVWKCSKYISRGYGMSSSAKTAVVERRGFENYLIWVKTRNTNLSRSECEWRVWKYSKSIPMDYERCSCVKNAGRNEVAGQKLMGAGQKLETEVRTARNSSEGSRRVQNGLLLITKRFRVQKRQPKRGGWSRVDRYGSKTRNVNSRGWKCNRSIRRCSKLMPSDSWGFSGAKHLVGTTRVVASWCLWVLWLKRTKSRNRTVANANEGL